MSRTRLRGEIAALLRLATPVAVSQLALIGMSVTDVVVAGWAGTDQLAGMMLGTNLWTLVALFYLGIGLSAQPLIGHAFGAGKNRVIRRYFHNAIYAGFGLGALCALSVAGAAWGLLHLGYEPQLASVGSSYLAVMVFAAPAMSLLPVLRSTLEAMSQTARVTRVLVGAFLLNIPLDLLFVMGFGPFPGMGAAGCAIASTIVLWLTVYLLSLSLGARSGNRHLRLLQKFSRPDGAIMLESLKLGLPIGITITIELAFFVAAAMLVAYFGAVPASAHSIAISTASVAFMLYSGLGQGIAIRAAQFLGAGDREAAWFTVTSGFKLTFAIALVASAVLLVGSSWLPRLYSADEEVVQLAALLLLWAAVFQLVDSVQCVAVYALRAYRDTLSPVRFQIFAFWVFAFPVGHILASQPWSPLVGAQGYWAGMTVGLAVAAIMTGRHLIRRARPTDASYSV